jgi:tripartite-type tricarboxylate transporter receptor subunit TctC
MKTCFLVVMGLLFSCSTIQAQAPYFQGNTIRIVTGYAAGDVNDLWPRLVAQCMTKYIPGNPSFVV